MNSSPKNVDHLRDAADAAMHVIQYLADRKTIIEKADFDSIYKAKTYTEELSDVESYEFWRSYSRIALLLPDDESPSDIYYGHLYNSGEFRIVKEPIRTKIAQINRANGFLFVFSSIILILLVFMLAYTNALSSLTENSNKLINEIMYFDTGRYDLTRFAGNLENCKENCKDNSIFGEVLQSSLNSVVGVLDFMLDGSSNHDSEGVYTNHTSSNVVQNARMIISFINGYLVPLVAGLLGASLSLLREIYLGFRHSRLNVSTLRVIYARLALGAISGIAVGWFGFWLANDGDGVAFTPLLLGFGAGYGVEVIFSLLDRMVAVLTDRGNEPKSSPLTHKPQATAAASTSNPV